jgi:hypothetical protein
VKAISRRIGKIVLSIGLTLLSVVILLGFLLNSSLIQTLLANYWLNQQSKAMGIEVHVQHVDAGLFSRNVQLTGLTVYDHRQNLLANVGSLKTTISNFSATNLNLSTTHIADVVFQLHRYEGDSVSNFQRIINLLSSPSSSETPDFSIKCSSLHLDNSEFSFVDDVRSLGDTFQFFDFDNIHLSQIMLDARNVDILGENVLAVIDHLSFKEQDGVELSEFSSRITVSPQGIIGRATHIRTPLSDLNLDLRFETKSWDDYQDFISNVYIFAKFKPSRLNFDDVIPFAPTMAGMHNQFRFSGDAWGYVNNFQAKDFVASYGTHTQFKGDVAMEGLPDIDNTYFNLIVDEASTNANDIKAFLLADHQTIAIPEELNKLGQTDLTGELFGYLSDAQGDIRVTSDAGNIQTNFNLFYDTLTESMAFSGQIENSLLALGYYFEEQSLGNELRVNGSFDGRLSAQNDIDLSTHLVLENVEYQGRFIDAVFVNGDWADRLISATVSIDDNDGNAEVTGEVSIDPANSFVHVNGFLNSINLDKLNLLKDTNQPLLTSSFAADISGFNLDSLVGNVHLSGVQMTFKDTVFPVEHIVLSRQLLPQGFLTKVDCDFFSANVSGNYEFSNLNNIWYDIQHQYLSALEKSVPEVESLNINLLKSQDEVSLYTPPRQALPQTFDLTLNVDKTDGLLYYFFPYVQLSHGANLTLGYDGTTAQRLTLKLNADTASAFGFSISELRLDGYTEADTFRIDMSANELYQDKQRQLTNIALHSKLNDNTIFWQVNWLGIPEKQFHFDGDCEGEITVIDKNKILCMLDYSELHFSNQIWQFDTSGIITLDAHNGIDLDHIRFFNQTDTNEYLILDGTLSKQKNSSINVAFNAYCIDTWRPFLESTGLDLSGYISGEVTVFDIYNTPQLASDLVIEKLRINDFAYGVAHLKATVDEKEQSSYLVFDIQDTANPSKTYLSAKGYFYPNHTEQNFDMAISIPEIDLSFVKNYVESFSSSFVGKLEGQLALKGTWKEPLFYGTLIPHDAVIDIDYLNTSYALECQQIDFSMDSIVIQKGTLEDKLHKSKGLVSGGLYHHRFNDIRVDLNMEMNNLFALNTTALLNEYFYGKAFVTGYTHIYGDSETITIDVKGRTERNTDINVAYSSKVSVTGDNQFIRFVSKDTDSIHVLQPALDSSTQIIVTLDIEATPEALITFDMNIPPTAGVISASGSGNLRLNIDSKGELTMVGDYVLQDGFYDFSLEEKSIGKLINRRFYIERGGTMQWTGDPANMMMNISAIYSTRASLYPVLASYDLSVPAEDSENQRMNGRKVNVQSVINISGRMNQPEIKFDFRFPTIDEETRARFFSLVNSEDESELSKQTFYLLLFGNFTSVGNNSAAPDGTTPTSINALALTTEMLMNQLNSIVLQNLSNSVSFSANYKPEDANSTEQTQLSANVHFLDNRLLLDGVIGKGGFDPAVPINGSDVVGEFNAEYKVTDRFSAKVFNRSNERSLEGNMDGRSPYSQGVGISYKREFDSFKKLFRRKEND